MQEQCGAWNELEQNASDTTTHSDAAPATICLLWGPQGPTGAPVDKHTLGQSIPESDRNLPLDLKVLKGSMDHFVFFYNKHKKHKYIP